MSKLHTVEVAEPAAELREAIALLVVRYGCTVNVPVAWQADVTATTIEKLDATWNPVGVRVHMEARSASFPSRVNGERRKWGMQPLPGWQDHVIFEPDDLNPDVPGQSAPWIRRSAE